jgi:hypothetical protein
VHGHITSLAVARTHRKLGIATRLMEASRESWIVAAEQAPSADQPAEPAGLAEPLGHPAGVCTPAAFVTHFMMRRRQGDAGCVWRQVRVAARAGDQPGGAPPVHPVPGLRVRTALNAAAAKSPLARFFQHNMGNPLPLHMPSLRLAGS